MSSQNRLHSNSVCYFVMHFSFTHYISNFKEQQRFYDRFRCSHCEFRSCHPSSVARSELVVPGISGAPSKTSHAADKFSHQFSPSTPLSLPTGQGTTGAKGMEPRNAVGTWMGSETVTQSLARPCLTRIMELTKASSIIQLR